MSEKGYFNATDDITRDSLFLSHSIYFSWNSEQVVVESEVKKILRERLLCNWMVEWMKNETDKCNWSYYFLSSELKCHTNEQKNLSRVRSEKNILIANIFGWRRKKWRLIEIRQNLQELNDTLIKITDRMVEFWSVDFFIDLTWGTTDKVMKGGQQKKVFVDSFQGTEDHSAYLKLLFLQMVSLLSDKSTFFSIFN